MGTRLGKHKSRKMSREKNLWRRRHRIKTNSWKNPDSHDLVDDIEQKEIEKETNKCEA